MPRTKKSGRKRIVLGQGHIVWMSDTVTKKPTWIAIRKWRRLVEMPVFNKDIMGERIRLVAELLP